MKSIIVLVKHVNRTHKIFVNPNRQTAIVQLMGSFYGVLYKMDVQKIDEDYIKVYYVALSPEVRRVFIYD